MEEIFDQMNNEVDQNVVDKQCAEIVKKNLLIENENLIANLFVDSTIIRPRDLETLKVIVANGMTEWEPYNAKDVTALIEQNDCVRVELEKVKQHYKEFHLKESVETVREIVEEARVVKPLDNALNYACQYTKLSQELLDKFGNDHFGSIMGYGDYVIGDSVISRVYYVEGLGHNLFSVGQFCDSDIEVAFRKHTCFVHDINGADILTGIVKQPIYALSTSASSSTSDMHHPVRHQGITEETTHEDSPINHDVLHPSHNPVTGEPGSAQSSSENVNSANPPVKSPTNQLRKGPKESSSG
ncbi:hypothetical protein Tco_1446624 [Tanacetum coccineum]